MPTIALTNIADGADIDAAPHRNNYAAIQAAVNGLDGDNFLAGALAATAIVKARVSGDAASRLVVQADGKLLWGTGAVAGDTNLYRSGADTLRTDDNLVVGTGIGLYADGKIELGEMTAPTGVANTGRLFVEDNGAGKSRLVVIFGTGAKQVIATEP